MSETEYKENMFCCIHAVYILRLLGFKDFMTLYDGNMNPSVNPTLIKSYIDSNWEEITKITRSSSKKHGAYRDRRGTYHGNYIDKAAQKILDKSFGMGYITSEAEGSSIVKGLFMKVNGKIVLSTMDATKIPPSREYIQESFKRNVLNGRNINAPRQLSLIHI